MSNKYLAHLPKHLPLVVSGASLGVGVANYHSNRKSSGNFDLQIATLEHQKRIEQQSLNALKAIHKTIATKPPGTV